jgi:alpha-beta hydrolase superfamily lysophospholipase
LFVFGVNQELASKLTQRGFAMFALDHQGHGKSTGTRAYYPAINDVVGDLHQYVQIIDKVAEARYPGQHIPHVLFGHRYSHVSFSLFVQISQSFVPSLIFQKL